MIESLQHFVEMYGYFALFGFLAMGIIALPVPDEVLLTFSGYLTSYGHLSYPITIIVSFAGSMTGMMTNYYLGKKVGKPFLVRFGKRVFITPARLDRAEGWFRQYGIWTVAFGYFVPGVRHFSCYIAGVSHVKLWKYLMFAGAGALVWSAGFITLGHIIGANWHIIIVIFDRYVGKSLLVLAIIVTVILLFKKTKKNTV